MGSLKQDIAIRLIASDIDGTLLQNGERMLRPELLAQIDRISGFGVRFCAASGRQYPNLRRLFGPVAESLFYICENGALVAQGSKILSKTALPAEVARDIIEDILSKPGCEALISGVEVSYLMPKTEQYVDHVQNYIGNRIRVVKHFEEIPEEIIKISVYRKAGIAPFADAFRERWKTIVNPVVSGQNWFDFTRSDKGSGLRRLQEMLGLVQEETMAFGDQDNDVTMLRAAGCAYAMPNSSEQALLAAGKQTDRVETVLRALFRSELQLAAAYKSGNII